MNSLILDSSVIIAAERRNHTVRRLLEQVSVRCGEVAVGISVITVAELTHGASRANNNAVLERRLAFIKRLIDDVPVHPLTTEIAMETGRMEGELAAKGITIGFQDLAIGATALHVRADVATINARHFELIPGLKVVKITSS